MFKQKKRLILFISFLLIAGFLLTSLMSYYISVSSLRDQITHGELPLTSDNIYSEIQRDLLRPIFISSLMASDTFFRDWVLGGEQDARAVVRYLKEIQETYKTITAFFVSEKSLNYYHPEGLVKQVHPEEPIDSWYFRVRSMADEYETNVDIDSVNEDVLTVFINYRVYDYENNFIGVTGVGLTVNAVQQLINRYQQTYNSDIFFIDSDGIIKLSNNKNSHSKHYTEELSRLLGKTEFLGKMTASATTSLQYQLEGNVVSLNTRYIKEFDWYLVVLQSELKGSRKLINILLLNVFFCALVTLTVLFILNGTISLYQKDLEKMATTDKLTGLYNRQALDMLFSQIVLDQKRSKDKLSLLLMDIDHFKQVNDTYGHLAGDAVLEHLANLVTSRLREADIVCRWGGEEFLVLLKGCDLETASNMAEELRLGIMNNPLWWKEQDVGVTVSVGISEFQAHDTQEKLIDRADMALYLAKSKGRNQVRWQKESIVM